ncbi:VOC family protein [Agilicoccus flavus]|uniref:VOC family protein n=1 Tax=Agilicoccus flavus TaxID=2775968 RepID=UPI001CF6B518|nr:VOC family protein [Agilicoccus flavus]
MVSRTSNFCIDAADPYAQATWWAQVLDDFVLDDESAPGEDECGLEGPAGRWIGFLKVPEPKTVKNRMHMCLRPVDADRDAEVERILGLGATMVDDRRGHEGWAVLADPEGNEFCVLRTPADEAGVSRA